MSRIMIDPGHGSPDPGAVGPSGVREADINLVVGQRVAAILRASGVEATLTRTEDADLSPDNLTGRERQVADLQGRCDLANQANVDLFVSIHCNSSDSPDAHGTETFTYPGDAAGRGLAAAIQAKVVAALGTADRGVKEEEFWVLKGTKMPAALMELAFASNPGEERLLASPDAQEKAAQAVASGVLQHLGATKPAEPTPAPQPAPTVWHSVGPARRHDPVLEDKAWAYLRSKNPNAPNLVPLYVACGDLLDKDWLGEFARSCLETGNWSYGGIVLPTQNNYAGLGALDSNAQGQAASFPGPVLGVLAQFEHLWAYVTTAPLPDGVPNVDPRFDKVRAAGYAGTVKFFEDFGNGKWASSRDNYGGRIGAIMEAILATETPNHYGQPPDSYGKRLEAEVDRLQTKISRALADLA